MLRMFGVGTPCGLQGHLAAVVALCVGLSDVLTDVLTAHWTPEDDAALSQPPTTVPILLPVPRPAAGTAPVLLVQAT